MNNRKPRSSLKKIVSEEDDPVRPTKRRISFSGKKFIREFDTTEKAKDYDYSCEISDHTNGDDSSGQTHVTASALQSTVHISYANEMDKENTPLPHSITGVEPFPPEYDQQQKSFTLQLQTSVNVTLMPHEMNRSRQRMELSAGLEFSSFDSLSLSESEREKLRENSIFKNPVNDKTIDLLPRRMLCDKMEPDKLEKENLPQVTIMPEDISSVALNTKDLNQKTVLFENNDITCDFEDIDPQPIAAAAIATANGAPKAENISFNMEESKDYINYLEDDSTSSPLIPLDVISENGIKRKLNFLQLNEALNSGRIQLFPNGPRTPNTDRKARSQQRFWHGLGDENSNDERPLKADIKPRGTLNFNESMMMSPGPAIKPAKTISNNRFSQADELMLDNTNFLVHAKVGDETSSRNNSKCASRRETTYNNTTMELDNLEKDEAAVVAALERVTRQPPILQRMEEMDVSDIEPQQNVQTDVHKRLGHTMRLNETMEEEYVPPPDIKSRRTIQKAETIAENVINERERELPAAPTGEKEYVISRKSLHFAKDISSVDEDLQLTSLDPSRRQEVKSRRQTLHMVEPMDEDTNELQPHMAASKVEQSYSRAVTVTSLHNKHRQTIHQAEPIEEDIVKPLSKLKVQSAGHSVSQQHSVRRQTLLLAVPIEEDMNESKESHSPVTRRSSKRRQTVNMAIAVEEDLVKQQPRSTQKTIGPLAAAQQSNKRRESVHMAVDIEEDLGGSNEELKSASSATATTEHNSRRRHTVYMAEPIGGDAISPQKESSFIEPTSEAPQQINRRRETMHISEPIEEELVESPIVAAASQNNKHRQTLHIADPIEEDKTCLKPTALATQQSSRRRETLHMTEDIEEDKSPQKKLIPKPTTQQSGRHRKTLYMAEAIEEDYIGTRQQLNQEPTTSTAIRLSSNRRETLHMTEDIEEEVVIPKKEAPPESLLSNRRRQTLHMAEPIEEDLVRPQKELSSEPYAPPAIQRDHRDTQTKHMTETIGDNFVRPKKQIPQQNKTLHMTEDIEEESESNNPKALTTNQENKKRRETLHVSEDIEEDVVKTNEECNPKSSAYQALLRIGSRRETLHMTDDIEEEIVKDRPKEIIKNSNAMTTNQEITKRRETLHVSEDIEEDVVKTNEECNPKSSAYQALLRIGSRRETLHMTDDIEEEIVKERPKEIIKNSNALTTNQENTKRRNTLHVSEDIEEDVVRPNECNTKSSTDQALLRSGSKRETLHMTDGIEEEIVKPKEECNTKSTAHPASLRSGSRRETLHMAEDIEEDVVKLKEECNTKSMKSMEKGRRRGTLNKAEAIEENSFISPNKLSETAGAFEAFEPSTHPLKCNIFGQALDISDPFAVSEKNTKQVIKQKTIPEQALNRKPRQTLHMTEPIEEDICSPAPCVAQSVGFQNQKKSRKTITMPEAMEEDFNSFAKEVNSPVKKPRKTIHVEEAIDEEMDTSPTVQQGGKSKLAFLNCMAFESPNNNNTKHELLAQSVLSQAIKNKEQSPEKNKSIFNPSIARIIMETPTVNKTQNNFFPITPGRSMIEYEDLEEICNADSEIHPSAVTSKISSEPINMDMDISSCGTPVQMSKPMTSFNIKRLPIHLTPNLPEAKKRNMRLPTEMDYHKDRDDQQQTPVARNKSRIPVLSKSVNLNSSSSELEHLDGTVQMVRAQMMGQARNDFNKEVIRPMEEKLKANTAAYEDNPITISDVSSHFAAQQEMAKQSHMQPIDIKNMSVNSRNSNENSNRRYAKVHKEFINISGDTLFFDAAAVIDDNIDENEVDKTRLSLVSTLLDEENVESNETADGSLVEFDACPQMNDDIEEQFEDFVKTTTICLQKQDPPAIAGTDNACKRCNHCRCSMNATAFSGQDSFVLPDWNGLEKGLKLLESLRQQPTVDEVHRYWQLKKMERYSEAGEILEESSIDLTEPVQLSLPEMLHLCNKKLQEFSITPSVTQMVEPFVNRLDAQLRAQKRNRWIFNYQLQGEHQYIFTHRKITTLRIVINYEPQDVMENEIRVRSIIGTTPVFIPETQDKLPDKIQHLLQNYGSDFKVQFLNASNWSTFEHLLDFQLRLKLPLNLHNLLDSNDVDGFVQFLERIDIKCREATKLCSDMQLLLIANKGQLLRQSNRTIVRKTIRKYTQFQDEAFMRIEKTQFIIEIGNVEKLSFNDIVQPPLYQFNEKIRFLPKGIAFLKAFLPNPEQFLRPNVESNI